MASITQVGLWFEIILMWMLTRYTYDLDAGSAHARHALTKVGDETRRSVMSASVLVAEETLDRLERSLIDDGRLQPL